jgi:hypothetical protein
MAATVKALVWKSENFGTDAPCIAVQVAGGTYGVWVAIFQNGRATGAARPIGSGSRLTRDEAIAGAKQANFNMGGPSATGGFHAAGMTA